MTPQGISARLASHHIHTYKRITDVIYIYIYIYIHVNIICVYAYNKIRANTSSR